MEGKGWRPPSVQCRNCGTVNGTVSDARSGHSIGGATVVAVGTNFEATTGNSGRFTLRDSSGHECVPAGKGGLRILHTDADMYQQGINPVAIVTGGSVNVPIRLRCTVIEGTVKDADTGQPIGGAEVFVVDTNDNSKVAKRPDGSLVYATSRADGTFVINCVPHGTWDVLALGPPPYGSGKENNQTVQAPGLSGITIKLSKVMPGCADVIGKVTDAGGQPIPGATVSIIGDGNASTISDGTYTIPCVAQGDKTLLATATNCQPSIPISITVPASGSISKDIMLTCGPPAPTSACRVDDIYEVLKTSNQAIFQVQYYVDPLYPEPVFIGAEPFPGWSNGMFAFVPAGRLPNGIPKGQHSFSDNVTVGINYQGGSNSMTTSTLKILIYDRNQEVCSKVFNITLDWGTP